MRNQVAPAVVALIIILLNIQCATIFKGTKQDMSFDGGPGNVSVWINGVESGQTPLRISLKVNEEYTIEFRKPGYKSKSYKISNSVGAGWVVLDVLGGLLPVIIDAATGSWYSLDQSHINAVLEAQQ